MKILLTTALLTLLTPTLALAQYNPLVGLPYVNGNQDIGSYVNALYLLAIAVAAFLAVIKIIFGGVNYMLSDVVTDKSQAKKDIKGALLGLLIVLAAVLVLNTINPSLTNLDVLRNAERMTFRSDGAISLGTGGGGVNPGPRDYADIGNMTDAEIAQMIAACVGPNNDTGYVWTYDIDAVTGRTIGQCVRDDTTGGTPDSTDYGGQGVVIDSPETATVIQDVCNTQQRPYNQTQTTVGGQSVTVGYCGTACTPQEQFDATRNRCIPYTQVNPTIDCNYVANMTAHPEVCGNRHTIIIDDYQYELVRSGNTVQLNCDSIDLDYESSCRTLCATGNGTLSAGGMCTFTAP